MLFRWIGDYNVRRMLGRAKKSANGYDVSLKSIWQHSELELSSVGIK